MLDSRVLAVGLLAVAFGLYQAIKSQRSPKLDLPLVGSPGDPDVMNSVVEGFKKYPNSPFQIPSTPNIVILPMSMYMEVKRNPALHHNIERLERFMADWTMCRTDHLEILEVVKRDLGTNMESVLPLVQEEVRYGMGEWGVSSEWKQVPVSASMQRMISLISGSVFVGKDIGRRQEWLDLSVNYTYAIGKVQKDYMSMSPLFAHLFAPFLKSVRSARSYITRAQEWLEPLVSEVLEAEKQGLDTAAPGTPGAFISWMLQYVPDEFKTAKRVSINQMVTTVAAIHNTSNVTSLILLDLAQRPEYVDILRDEIQQELSNHDHRGDENGNKLLDKTALGRLTKLDSFIKESQRWSGVFFVPPLYKTTEDVTFSNGLKLPKKTRVGFPVRGVDMSPTTAPFTPEMCEQAGTSGPDIFDGLRFEKLRKVPGQESKHYAVSTSTDSLLYGHGQHSCPGRFFATYEMKSIIVQLLLDYDFRLLGDVKQQGGEAMRPEDVIYGTQRAPNPNAILEVRKRDI